MVKYHFSRQRTRGKTSSLIFQKENSTDLNEQSHRWKLSTLPCQNENKNQYFQISQKKSKH